MFRVICTLLTTVGMLAHSVLGCGICHAGCEHAHSMAAAESHSEHDDYLSESGHSHAVTAQACCDHQHLIVGDTDHPIAGNEHPRHCPGDDCSAIGCSYVGATLIKLPMMAPSIEMLPCDLLAISTPAHLESIARAADRYCCGYPPTLRAQIWLSTWLV